MNTQTYTASGTYNHVFVVEHKCEVVLDVYGTFDSGTLTLTRSPDIRGNGTYHTVTVATDATALLTGAALTVTAALMAPVTLAAGSYGVVIASAGGSTSIKLDVSGRWAYET